MAWELDVKCFRGALGSRQVNGKRPVISQKRFFLFATSRPNTRQVYFHKPRQHVGDMRTSAMKQSGVLLWDCLSQRAWLVRRRLPHSVQRWPRRMGVHVSLHTRMVSHPAGKRTSPTAINSGRPRRLHLAVLCTERYDVGVHEGVFGERLPSAILASPEIAPGLQNSRCRAVALVAAVWPHSTNSGHVGTRDLADQTTARPAG